jgi:hypothetical protein
VRIEILDQAELDLVEGFHFYEGEQADLAPIFSTISTPTLICFTKLPGFI